MELKFKFNTNHDPANGRFTFGSGLGFVSPQTREGLDFDEATRQVDEAEHRAMLERFRAVDEMLGLDTAKTTDAVGAWSDGAENSSVSRYGEGVDYPTLKTSLAMKGLLARQKAVVAFKADPNGKQAMYYTDIATRDYEQLHRDLLQSGVEYHTIAPTARGARVYSFDSSDDGAGASAFNTFIRSYHVKARVLHGHGEFVGSWTDRDEGRKAYETEIAAFLGQRGLRRGRLAERWRRLQSDAGVQKLDPGLMFDGDGSARHLLYERRAPV